MFTKYLLPALAVISFSFAILQMTKAQQTPATVSPPVDPGKSPFGRQVAGAGIVEPETDNIVVGTHVAGVVKAVHVRVDDRIAAGAPLQVNVRPGEYVGTTPGQAIVALGTVGRLHVRVDVDENDIGRFKPGMKGTASPRGEPNTRYPLAFVRVEPFVIPKKSLTGGNTERVDTRVLQVIYAIEANVPLYVGQQLDVSLDADK